MKTLKNKITTLKIPEMEIKVNNGKRFADYSMMILTCINTPNPQNEFSDLKKLDLALSVKRKLKDIKYDADIVLENAEFEYVSEKVKVFAWSSPEEDFSKFEHYINSIK